MNNQIRYILVRSMYKLDCKKTVCLNLCRKVAFLLESFVASSLDLCNSNLLGSMVDLCQKRYDVTLFDNKRCENEARIR